MKAAGFSVTTKDVSDTAPERKRLGMPDKFAACHTASVEGYVIEGHVPAAEVKRLLASRPAAIGLAVLGMPLGSPGMEVNDRIDPYEVLLVDRRGQASVFARYPNEKEATDEHRQEAYSTVTFMLATAAVAAQIEAIGRPLKPSPANSASANADADKAEGEVRKVDKEARKLTLRHGPIPNLEMPEMTMVFRVSDPKMLDGLEAKKKVRFTADRVEGQLTVTSLEVVQ